MLFRRKSPESGDPRRIWIEELLGPAQPNRLREREDLIARLLAGGGNDMFRALRGGPNPASAR